MVDALVKIVLEKLNHVLGQQLSLSADVKGVLEKLSFTFQSIRAVLDDAESRQVSDEYVKLWLSRVRHVAYDTEDLLGDGQIYGFGDQEGNEDDGNNLKKLWLRLPYNPFDHKRKEIALGIKEIREKLDEIADDKNRYGFLSSTQVGDHRTLTRSRPPTTSLMEKTEMIIGRENDKEIMISRLVSGSSHEDGGQAQVVAISGSGGLGKTTLARQIYHDRRVRGHFNKFLWVCVSEAFDVKRLIKEIIEEVKGTSTSLSGLNSLQNELVGLLRGMRFLLVLDDVWNDDVEKWKMLQLPLNSGTQESRIMVTTRGQKVAETMNATYIHKLQGLSKDDSWEVFRSRAFAGMTPEKCSKLENVGRQIVNKCKGVPLAITVMGSAMSSKRTIADWQNILDSKMWSLRDAKNGIFPSLWLSYSNLPSQLKLCFVYCSMFPKDWVLEKDMLVRLWAAQGFIRSDGNRDIEAIGADYFDDLVAWSLFQEVKQNSKGKITGKMHDLLYDLAESIAKDEIYTFIRKSEQCPSAGSNVRHSFLFFKGSIDLQINKIRISLRRAKKLRTLFLRCHGQIDIVDIFGQARFVRALVFSGFCSGRVKLPNAISNLKHLRYLDLSGYHIVELPESVSDLRKLDRLSLNDCKRLEKLPRGIGRMVSLRHLEIKGTNKLKYLPKGLGKISDLRSLSKFIVRGGDKGEGCGMDELQPLNSLQGTLEMVHLERVSSREEAEKAELWKKQHLCSLELWKKQRYPKLSATRDDDAETGRIDSVLEGLRPHGNLENLEINGLTGSMLPRWMDGMRFLEKLVLRGGPIFERVPHLPNLKEFEIWELRNEVLPDEGWERLVALQILSISDCKELKCLPEGLTQLPSLENLSISYCDKLESLPEGLGQFSSLENLDIRWCEGFKSLPEGLGQLRKLTSLEIRRSHMLRRLPDSIGQLESLERLEIDDLKKLESLPDSLSQLKKLKTLEISSSEVLICLPDSVGRLESLEHLQISDLKELKSLPVSLGQLKKLKSLYVSGSKVLTHLPDSIGQLESLESLGIHEMEKLEALPQGLRHLTLLQVLEIKRCPLLRERCKRGGGVDWPNISHIPNIIIDKHQGFPNRTPLPGSTGNQSAGRSIPAQFMVRL